MNLLIGPVRFDRFCFTVQRELADRLSAVPGTRDFGPTSIAIQCTSRLTRVATLPPQVFWPRPAVVSAMIRIDVERNPFETPDRLARFIEFVRTCFAHRRKTLKYNLARVVESDELAALAVDFDQAPTFLGGKRLDHMESGSRRNGRSAVETLAMRWRRGRAGDGRLCG